MSLTPKRAAGSWNNLGNVLSPAAFAAGFIPGVGNFVSEGLSGAAALSYLKAGKPRRAAEEGMNAAVSLAFGAAGRLIACGASRLVSAGMRLSGRPAMFGQRFMRPLSAFKQGRARGFRKLAASYRAVRRVPGARSIIVAGHVMKGTSAAAIAGYRPYAAPHYGWNRRNRWR